MVAATDLGGDMHPADVDRFDDALGQRHGGGWLAATLAERSPLACNTHRTKVTLEGGLKRGTGDSVCKPFTIWSDQNCSHNTRKPNQLTIWSERSHNTRKKNTPNQLTIWSDQNCSQIKSPYGLTKTVHRPENQIKSGSGQMKTKSSHHLVRWKLYA